MHWFWQLAIAVTVGTLAGAACIALRVLLTRRKWLKQQLRPNPKFLPESVLFPSDQHFREAVGRFYKRPFRVVFQVSILALGTSAGALLAQANFLWPVSLLPPLLRAVLGGSLLPAVIILAWALLMKRRLQRHLRRELNDAGVPICINCGYQLTGNISGTCPECGTAVPGRDASAFSRRSTSCGW